MMVETEYITASMGVLTQKNSVLILTQFVIATCSQDYPGMTKNPGYPGLLRQKVVASRSQNYPRMTEYIRHPGITMECLQCPWTRH